MSIELRQLRYFIAVAEEMHFGRAARRLHMTQPPLSQAIQALEARLGAELFQRTRRSVTLSAAGHALLPEARRLLLQADALPSLVQRAAAGESGSLSIAFVSMADYSVMPQALREFRAAYPSVQIQLHEATTDLQLEMLSAGEIDLGMLVMPLPDKSKSEFDSLLVLSEPLMLALPEGLVRKRGPVALDQLSDQPLIVFPRRLAPAFHDKILGRFHEAGLTPRIGQEAIQMQTIIALVSAGMGIALVPQSVSNLQRPGVEYRALKEAGAPIDMGLAWRRDNDSPVLAAFVELMRKTSGKIS